MKNICIITQCSLPVPAVKGGAVETLVEYLIDENEKKGDYHFTVITVDDDLAKSRSKNYKYTEFVCVTKGNSFFNKILLFLYRVLKHLNIYIPFSLEFGKVLRLLKKSKRQDLYIYEAGPTTQIPLLSKIVGKEKLYIHLHWDGMGNKRIDNSFNKLIAISDYIGKCWSEATQCDESKIVVLPNCAKMSLFSKVVSEVEKNKLKNELNIDSGKVILFVGRIVQEKGVKELLKAVDQLNDEDVCLLIVGSANFGNKTNTPYEKEIIDLLKKTNKRIIMTGYVHHKELYKYYSMKQLF